VILFREKKISAYLTDLRSEFCIFLVTTAGFHNVLQIAQICKRHDTIGQDLVALCVNDILAEGAEPLFFLSYFACGKLDVELTETMKEGIAEACRNAGCAFLGMNTPLL